MGLLAQTAGSLVAILALAGVAWWLKLGGAARLDSDETVRRAAGEVEDGFIPVAIARDARGRAAIVRDGAGRIMVIRLHGNRFAGRVLGADARAWLESGTLIVDPGEARFGVVEIDTPEASTWAAAINRLHAGGNA